MPQQHVFLSYASGDANARAVAAELEARGFEVWWDREIPPGRQYDDVIEEALGGAFAVAVLWSQASAASQWVRIEASEAMKGQRLVPAVIEPGVRIPLEFSRVQAADLGTWQPGSASPAFGAFADAISRLGGMPRPTTAPTPAPAPTPRPSPSPVPAPAPISPERFAGLPKPAWIGIAVLAGIVVGWSALEGSSEDDGLPSLVSPISPPGGAAAAGGIDMPLRWRDYVLAFDGRVSWDGRANVAQVSATVIDSGNGQKLAGGTWPAVVVLDAPGRIVMQTQVPVPGDTRTAGAHSHPVNLVFEQRGAAWVFARNCMTPGRPDTCY